MTCDRTEWRLVEVPRSEWVWNIVCRGPFWARKWISQLSHLCIDGDYNGPSVPVNYVRESLRLAFPAGTKRRIAVMLAGYFDESGTHGRTSKTVVVAGYVADSSRWVAFDNEWKSALADYKLSWFHMKDYVSEHKKYRWGKKREARLARLQTITRRAVSVGIGVVLDREAWERHVQTPKDRRYFGTSVYDFCATGMLGMVGKWAHDEGVNEGIAYHFEQGACGWKQFQQTYIKCYNNPQLRKFYRMLGGLELKDKKIFRPLQTADIAAYALYKARPRLQCRKFVGWGGVPHLEDVYGVPVRIVLVDDAMLTAMKRKEEYLSA